MRVLWPAAREDTPRIWTSFSTAIRAASAGVWKSGSHIDVEAAVGIAGSYNLGATVVTVLAYLGNHDTGLTAFALGKFGCHLLGALEVGVLFCFA